MGVKFGTEEGTFRAKFHPHQCNVSPLRGEKPENRPLCRLNKLNMRAQLQNLPLSNGIKIVSVLQRLHGEIKRTNSDVQKRDGQTNRQTETV